MPRSDWAIIRKTYFLCGQNRQSLELIEKSIAMVILSEESPSALSEKGKNLLHGDGKSIWFDKCVNVVFFKNGQCGLNVGKFKSILQ